jgi:glycosyltransferase involved in cell wall biosynthesis
MPAVSVVIPSYNHAGWVAAAVRSALAQTLADLEVIVVDDGSTDDSRTVLAGLRDPRLTVVEQANAGAHAALNTGIERAQAPLIAILNSDDLYRPERLATCVAALTADVSLVGSWIEIVDADQTVVGVKHGWRDCEPWLLAHPERSFRAGADPRAALLTEHYLGTTSNFVFRRADWQAVGGFRPLRYAHDWDFALRLAERAPPRLIEAPLLRYRVHDRNTIREDRAAMVLEICWCLAVHLPRQVAAPWFGGAATERLAQLPASLFTYGCDAVLASLLACDLAHDERLALALLDPAEPRRQPLLAAIRERLAEAAPTAALSAGVAGRALRWLRSRRYA